MQVQRSTDQNLKGRAYKNSLDALKHITKTEGMSGIYKGTQLSSFIILRSSSVLTVHSQPCTLSCFLSRIRCHTGFVWVVFGSVFRIL
jgi:hypothetical protein